VETFSEGVVVFDPYGRMVYANQRARRTLDALGDGVPHRGENLRERLMAFGARARALKQGSLELGEVVFMPEGGDSPTLAERERQAILDTLEVTHGKLAETARRSAVRRCGAGCVPMGSGLTGTEARGQRRASSALGVLAWGFDPP
jgi:PAS domain-containing protein